MTKLLSVENIVKQYSNDLKALNGVSFEVNTGDVLAIVGPSGCGKSTLLRCLNGLEEVQDGKIVFDGQTITDPGTKWQKVRQQIGMVFQSYELFSHLSVMKNLLLAPKVVANEDQAQATERAQKLLERVGLADRADALPSQLSGGQKQRIAIVRALMMSPEILLLDEITASLDPEMVREVLNVISELAKDGMTMILVTHEMAFARALADQIIFMDAGQVIETGKPEDFFERPQTLRAQKFLDTFVYEI